MNKNDTFQILIEDMTDNGEGIGRCNGYTLFVKDSVIGDFIEGKVIKAKKTYGYGRLTRVITPSPDRVTLLCPVAAPCGGCQLQALSYDAQLRFKYNRVLNHLKRIGGFENVPIKPVIGMEISCACAEDASGHAGCESGADTEAAKVSGSVNGCESADAMFPLRYRNKAQYPIGRSRDGRVIAGFYAGRTHSIIECEDCLLGDAVNSKILKIIISHMEEYKIEPYDEEAHSGLVRHVLIRKGRHTGEIMVCIVINGTKLTAADRLAQRLCEIAGMTSISLNVNRKKGNVILGDRIINISGPGYITDKIKDISYHISPLSFFQVNPIQTEKLYSKALEFAGLTGSETVWDLYCGIGTISLFLARAAKRVYGVEIIPAAIENAKENARLNSITNAEFFVGKSEEVLPEKYAQSGGALNADVIVVDPPRKGCDENLLEVITCMQPQRIVYVSCDSATLARDLKYICERGYKLKEVQPVDMFPMTGHVETVALLSKLHEAKHHVNVKLDMDELDLTSAEAKATYKEIQDWVQEKYGFHVTNLNIAQVKQKHGIIERENYNKPKSPGAKGPVDLCPARTGVATETSKQPGTSDMRIKAIEEAMRHFQMI